MISAWVTKTNRILINGKLDDNIKPILRQWHSSTLAWKIPWTEEPVGLQSMGSLRVGHDWAISLSLSCIGEGNGNPLQCSCLENPRDGGAWWAAIYGVAELDTKRLSRSSSKHEPGTSLVVQGMRMLLLMQETWVQSLVWEDSTCCGATKC